MSTVGAAGTPSVEHFERMRVGFIVTTPYQLFHFGAIRRHLDCEIYVYVEVRRDDFGMTKELIEEQMGDCRIKWLYGSDLKKIDGECTILVCQTLVPVMQVFEKSMVVAQQYSLAKEQYQFGPWRAQADLNLMYGQSSAEMAAPYAHVVASGNPLFDNHVPAHGPVALRAADPQCLRVLYMPTYGDLSDRSGVLDSLLSQNVELSIKAHHADFEIQELAREHGIPIDLADADPIAAIRANDLVVSDYSGAIYDALAMRTPVAVVEALNDQSEDLRRLSDNDVSRSSISDLAATWSLDQSLRQAYDQSREALADEVAYRRFLDHFFVNFGSAGAACARHIRELAAAGPPESFAVTQVRMTMQRYVLQNRELRARLRKAERRAALGRSGLIFGPEKWPALRSMLQNDPPRVVILKSTRYALRAMPGGDRVLQRLRTMRSRRKGAGTQADSGFAGQAARPDGTAVTLSPIPHQRRLQLLELVQQAFDAAGLDHRSAASEYQAYIAIREEDLDVLLRALQSLSSGDPAGVKFWLGAGAKYSTVRHPNTVRMRDLVKCESLVVGVPHQDGSYSIQQDGGVEVLILGRRDTRLVARRGRAEKVDWTREFAADSVGEVTSRPPVRMGRSREDEFVDVVYTWVDSSDPEWMRERAAWSGESEIVMASAANDERYLDRDELRYSLRSVWAYAPFVRNIYIVTHGHRPDWLVGDNDRIRVVSHEEIFPDKSVLPTFNSHAIEASLHRIPGLAENFLYFNDDVFLGRETRFSDFYTKAGLIISRFSPSSYVADVEPGPGAIPTDWASYNAVKLMSEDFGMPFDRKLKHVPHAMKKSLLEEMEERYPDVFEVTRASRFRDHSDYAIPSMLAHYYGIATGRAVDWANLPNEYVYADTGRRDFEAKLHRIPTTNPMFVCLNVTMHTDLDYDRQATLLQAYLSDRYPVPSPYELSSQVSEIGI